MRQRLLAEVRPDCFEIIGGTTDSEVCFALILSLLEPEKIREGSVTPKDMKAAVIATINLIRHFLEENYSTYAELCHHRRQDRRRDALLRPGAQRAPAVSLLRVRTHPYVAEECGSSSRRSSSFDGRILYFFLE